MIRIHNMLLAAALASAIALPCAAESLSLADLADAQSAIRAMSDELHGSADKMSALSQRVNEALASGNIDQLKQITLFSA